MPADPVHILRLQPIGEGAWRLRDAAVAEDNADAVIAYVERRDDEYEVTWVRGGGGYARFESVPALLDGAELNEHQVDALSGTLAALSAEIEEPGSNGNGNGRATSSRFSTPSWAEVPTWTWHDRQLLDDILADAVKVASRMGESLVYSLTPIATTGSKGGTSDA